MAINRALIADDDDTFIRVMTVRCRHLGLDVTTTSDAIGAREVILSDAPDLVMLDVDMPRCGAFGVCQTIANHKRLQRIPVIILAGHTDRQFMDECRRYGAFYMPNSPYVWNTPKPMIGRWMAIPGSA